MSYMLLHTCNLLQVYHRPSSSNSCVPAASTIAYLSDRLTYDGEVPLVPGADGSLVREGASTAVQATHCERLCAEACRPSACT